MVAPAPKKPFVYTRLYLDQGTKAFAGKTLAFQGTNYIKRVVEYGTIERTMPAPPGLLQISDAQITLADTDNQLRDWFDTITPLRRLADITFDFEENAGNSPTYDPDYTGEIINVKFPPGQAILSLRDVTAMWLDRPIPHLVIRDNFANMPDDLEVAFAPIIFGNCFSYTATNVEPQGMIKCHHCDTKLHRYIVARHTCHSIPAVYRKLKGDTRFFLVNPIEYNIVNQIMNIGGIAYNMTFIQFLSQQVDGTIIHADVSGLNYYYDFNTHTQINSASSVRNPILNLVSLIYYLLLDEVNIQRFDDASFLDTQQRCDEKSYTCDGAITESTTAGLQIARLTSDFNIDFTQTSQGKIRVHMYDPEIDAGDTTLITIDNTLRKSLNPAINDRIKNRFRFRLYRQNAGLTEYVLHSNTGQWGLEYVADYTKDQNELAATGENPIIEGDPLELFFIRDANVAFNVVKRRICYHTLRSYITELDVPGPLLHSLSLGNLLSVTHPQGVGLTGWTDKVMKVYGLTFNLKNWVLSARTIILPHVSDADIALSGSPPSHDTQRRYPYLPVTINGTLDGLLVDPDASPQVNIRDDYPQAPDSDSDSGGLLPSSFSFSKTDGSSRPLPKSRVSFVNVRWQEDKENSPRQASGYVPIPALTNDVQFFTGTLNPDQRPTGLTSDDFYRVVFYATDFDHMYWYVGTGEAGSSSGWLVIDQTDSNIQFRIEAPLNRGWHLCDGSTGVDKSDYKGDISTITVPNLIGAYPKGASSYSGPTATNPTAPGASSSSAGAHNHAGSSVASHTHSVSITSSSAGDHAHTNDVTDPGHSHGLSGVVTDDVRLVLQYSSISATTGEGTEVDVMAVPNVVITDQTNGPHSCTGTSVGECHYHSFTSGQETDSTAPTSSGFSINVNSNGAHTHDVSGSTGSASPSLTISTDGSHSHSVTVDTTGEPKHMGLLPYIRL